MAPVIHFDYDFSPYGQKTKLLLAATQTPFQKSDQPIVLPRPDLQALGIAYRRIPLLAIGKDVYVDSAHIIQKILSELAVKPIKRSPADHAYAVWGDTVFSEALAMIPSEMLTEGFVKDREAIFPFLTRPDLKTLRPSAVAQFRSRLRQVEEEFLAGSAGPFIGGSEISLADIHVVWTLRWALKNLGIGEKEGAGREQFPKVWKLVESLPEAAPEVLDASTVKKRILGSEYTAKGPVEVEAGDAYGIEKGASVNVESFDSTPGSFPQAGKLVGTTIDEVVIEIKDGIRLHFPKIGYIVRRQ
ncbi:hypothetical protein M409DRAFT_65989 [Zasmidium cellare ATCC 36951]|uniref:GST C-terminal domain-containing protein n=1 Tax=Zasmidium cellare ATCC 36951 TaxID=1080233 RepID=A0A6A6CPB7_ZASCE|nr:uncharacterized protein M409DRAFT_65989 [Zasmidium cellare ATCC 36951]KAF2167960.1 hypothetical protein M409DRAFT_65989 [Zasmidium cellare ATCC 36951]